MNIYIGGWGSLDDKHQYTTSNDSGSLYRSYINITDKALYNAPNKKDVPDSLNPHFETCIMAL